MEVGVVLTLLPETTTVIRRGVQSIYTQVAFQPPFMNAKLLLV